MQRDTECGVTRICYIFTNYFIRTVRLSTVKYMRLCRIRKQYGSDGVFRNEMASINQRLYKAQAYKRYEITTCYNERCMDPWTMVVHTFLDKIQRQTMPLGK